MTISLHEQAAVIIRPTFPFIKWIKAVINGSDFEHELLEFIKEKSTRDGHIYLVDPLDSEDDISNLKARYGNEWLKNELQEWQIDPELWPQGDSVELFSQWFTVAYCDMVFSSESPA